MFPWFLGIQFEDEHNTVMVDYDVSHCYDGCSWCIIVMALLKKLVGIVCRVRQDMSFDWCT